MANELRTQGTEIWYVSAPTAVTKIGNVTAFGDFGKQANDLITTNLDSAAVEKMSGLADNGDASLTINLEAGSAAHQYLEANAGTDTRVEFCIGLSDGTTPPTAVADEIVPPVAGDRTSLTFLASVKSFRLSVGVDAIVSVAVSLGISGAITPVWKA